MTSSNAAPTDEGRADTIMTSPPPAVAAAATPPSPPPRLDGNASGAAILALGLDASNADLNLDSDAPAQFTSLNPKSETRLVSHCASAADPDQPRPDPPSYETFADLPTIPSPPTVSPLSTPAATHVNVDDNMSDDTMARLATDLPPPPFSRDSIIFRSGIFGPSQSANHKTMSVPEGMELDEPFMPGQAVYRVSSQVEAIATTDPDPQTADYSSHGMLSGMRLSQGSIDPSAYMMNLNAPATHFQDTVPPVIHPSAVSLQALAQCSDVLTGSTEPTSTTGSQKLESFARIEFADSTFQMTTYAVIIGRDKQAMEQARADERRETAYRRKCEENERNGLPPPTPITYDRGKFSKSYVSEEGGMLGPEHSDGEEAKPAKRRRLSSAAQPPAGEDNASASHIQSNRQYVSHTPGAAAVDLGVLQPSPEHIPFIGIHSPGPDIASKTRGISRQHLKIQFNKKRGVFEGIALHKNGFFCDDVLHGLDQPATLRSGDRLQIKDVEFYFVINGVQTGMSGGEEEDVGSSRRMSVGGKEMSLDFEHSDHENFRDTSEELSDVEDVTTPAIESEHGEGEPEPASTPVPQMVPIPRPVLEPELGPESEVTGRQSIAPEEHHSGMIKPELDLLGEFPPDFAMPDIPRRRGPGRPPKDGIMSKRERRLLKKQMQETSKKTVPQDPQEEKIKRPVGRPRKNPLPEDIDRAEKRKYNKKKREDGEEGSDIEKRAKEKKDKKVRPKSPPLDLRAEDYTSEQLQKPTKNYGVLIDEALTNGPPDGLTLKQIYKRITARYPWFFFSAETKGWESSVRHNLIGNEAFKKDEETGLWSRVPGVELDAGKKRKASSPDRLGPSHLHSHLSHPPYYQNSHYTNSGGVAYAHGLPNYTAEQKHPQTNYTAPGQNTQAHTTPSQTTTQPVYTAHVPAPAQLPPGYGSMALPRPSNTSQQSTYSSPYARPPPPSNPPANLETNMTNGQAAAATSATQPATPAPPNSTRPGVGGVDSKEGLTPEIERAITQFSINMLNVISKQTPHAQHIIDAAANTIRGLPVKHRVPGFESVEKTLVNAMEGMIRDMRQKHRHATSASPAVNAPLQASSTPSPAPSNTLEAEIQRRLRNFRESMVAALKTKTDKAEIIVDSAINRARGLPHASKIPGWEEADNLMVKSVTQIIVEARSAHTLKAQTASPAPMNAGRTAVQSQPITCEESSTSSPSAQLPITSAAPPAPQASHAPPGSGTSVAPFTPSTHPSVPITPSSNHPSMARPSMPLQRPAPVTLTRPPPMSSVARPTSFHKDSATTSSTVPISAPAVSRPNVSSPAPPSAGVLDQITGHKRFTDDAFQRAHGMSHGITTSASTISHPATTASSNVGSNPGASTASSSSVIKTIPSGLSTSNTKVSSSNHVADNTTNQTPSNAANGMTVDKPSISMGNPTNIVSVNTASNPVGDDLSGAGSNSISNAPTSIPSSIVHNQTSTTSSASDSNLDKISAASNTSSITPGLPSAHVPSGTPSDPTSTNTGALKAPATDIINQIAATAKHGFPGATPGVNNGLTSGTAPANALTNKDCVDSSDVNHIASNLTSKVAGSPLDKSVEDGANSKVESEKGNSGKATVLEHREPTAALKAPAPIHNMSSPAPPSAGVVDQIAGHKRSLDEGPGSANAEQPEAKRLGVSPT